MTFDSRQLTSRAAPPARSGLTVGLTIRWFIFGLLLLFSAIWFTGNLENAQLTRTAPFFGIAILLYLLPAIVSPGGDLFSPVVFAGIGYALRLGATFVAVLVAGYIDIGLSGLGSEERRIELVQLAMAVHIVAQISYLLGYYLSSGQRVAKWLPRPIDGRWVPSRLAFVIIFIGIVATLAFSAFQDRLGGNAFDVARMGEAKRLLGSDVTQSWIPRGVTLALLPCILLCAAAFQRRSIAGSVAALGLFGAVAYLVTQLGQRGPAVGAIAFAVMLFHYIVRRVHIFWFLGAYIAAVMISNVLGDIRTANNPEGYNMAAGLSDEAGSPVEALARHGAERQRLIVDTMVVEYFPDKHPFLLGRSWLPVFVAPIPRWIWPGKAELNGYSDTGLAITLIGNMSPTPFPMLVFANFWWPGLVIIMYLWGAFHRGLHTWLHTSSFEKNSILMYTAILGTCDPTLLGVSAMMQTTLPLWVILWFITKKEPSLGASLAAGRA